MRYAIISDIHANLQALHAIQEDILKVGVDELICLGDIVGFGPDPSKVMDSIYANVHHFVMGNHDAAACGLLDSSAFNKDSRKIIEWTKTKLNPTAKKFLKEMPFIISTENFACVHAEMGDPGMYRYITQPEEAKASWDSCTEQIIFIGHTHIPAIYMVGEMGVAHYLPPQELRCGANMRYIVNVGSVGQSRDGDMRACYVVYDSEKQQIDFRRVTYDLDKYFDRMQAEGLPVHPCMLEGQTHSNSDSAKSMDFRPLDSKEKSPTPVVKKGKGKSPKRKSAKDERTQRMKHSTSVIRPGQGQGQGQQRSRRQAQPVKSGNDMTLLLLALIIVGGFIIIVAMMNRQPREIRVPVKSAPVANKNSKPKAKPKAQAKKPKSKKKPVKDKLRIDPSAIKWEGDGASQKAPPQKAPKKTATKPKKVKPVAKVDDGSGEDVTNSVQFEGDKPKDSSDEPEEKEEKKDKKEVEW